MTVDVIDRSPRGWSVDIVRITIGDSCPSCGGPRGTPYQHRFYEDGDWYTCDRWDNPCGHIDKYKDTLKEARKGIT